MEGVQRALACQQVLIFGRVKRVSRERASERQGSLRLPKYALLTYGNMPV